ncbi:hypothetical protein GCM10010447_29030 [Streptomyces fulvorobeus]
MRARTRGHNPAKELQFSGSWDSRPVKAAWVRCTGDRAALSPADIIRAGPAHPHTLSVPHPYRVRTPDGPALPAGLKACRAQIPDGPTGPLGAPP